MAATLEVTVGWGDCDPARIVFYPHYFRWFDAATLRLLEALGLGLDRLVDGAGGLRIPVVDSGATFQRPSRPGDRLVIESSLASWGRSSFRVEHVVHNAGVQALAGHEVRAWTEPDGARRGGTRAVALPAAVVAAFESRGAR